MFCQVVLGCDLFGDLIGSRHERAPSCFDVASSDINTVDRIEPASQAEP
jgi:hypothetical protein